MSPSQVTNSENETLIAENTSTKDKNATLETENARLKSQKATLDENAELKAENAELKAENAKLKADNSRMFTFPDWVDKFYGRILAIFLGMGGVWFMRGPVSDILNADIVRASATLEWAYGIYGVKVLGSIVVLCALLLALLALVRADQRD